MGFGKRSPDVVAARTLNPAVSRATENAFDRMVAERGGSLAGVGEAELTTLRHQARQVGKNQVYAGIDDPEWRYDQGSGRFRSRPLVTLALTIAGVLGTICGKILYEAFKAGTFP